jgi:hypothetical protein
MNKEIANMEPKHKIAVAGAGLVAVGIGLGVVGAAMIAPAVFAWTTRMMEKGAEGIASKFEDASKTVGTVAGTLHRSFSEATKAGVAEMRRGRDERAAG